MKTTRERSDDMINLSNIVLSAMIYAHETALKKDARKSTAKRLAFLRDKLFTQAASTTIAIMKNAYMVEIRRSRK